MKVPRPSTRHVRFVRERTRIARQTRTNRDTVRTLPLLRSPPHARATGKLEFFGLFMQAQYGDCPPLLREDEEEQDSDISAAKSLRLLQNKAWQAASGKTHLEAMQEYLDKLKATHPHWRLARLMVGMGKEKDGDGGGETTTRKNMMWVLKCGELQMADSRAGQEAQANSRVVQFSTLSRDRRRTPERFCASIFCSRQPRPEEGSCGRLPNRAYRLVPRRQVPR